MHGGETKYVFKRAMQGIVPDEILYRKKQGFGVPIQRWINNELRRIRDVVLDQRAIDRAISIKAI
jgi:asparagine synthase (glutamine-hydrolysing)